MRYKEFNFVNFKGIADLTLPLDGGVTTLIGLNESGKTTILEAIFCFSYGAEDLDAINPEMASLREPEQWIPIGQRANFNDKIIISAVVKLSDNDKQDYKRHMRKEYGLWLHEVPDEIKISEIYNFENSRYVGKPHKTWALVVKGTKGQQRNARTYSARTDEWQGAIAMLKEMLPRIWYFPNFLFELPERFRLTDGSDTDEERDKDRFYRLTFQRILTELGYGATLETHIVERLGSSERGDQRSLSSLMLDMGRLITTTIFGGWDRIFGRPPVAQEVELVADRDTDIGPFLELRIKGPDGFYDLSERSLGFRWFFMFLLMTSFHGVDEGRRKPLFLLDEPASNLHSSAQAELLKSFENLLDRCDLIYTTHSHHMINVRWLDAAYVVKNAALGSLDFADYVDTRVGARTSISATRYRRFVVDHPDQTSYFQPVLDLLEYRPSLLEPVPNVVLVEGKSDFFTLRYMSEVLGLNSALRTVPGGGAGSLDPLIRLYIGWGKSFLILLDGDSEGVKQRARYEREFGPLVAGKTVLLSEICDDAKVKECEDLLSAADKEAIISRIFLTPAVRPGAKKALRQAVIELYARAEPVEIEDTTITRVSDLILRLTTLLDA